MRADDRPIPPQADDDPASAPAALPQSNRFMLIIGRCIAFAGPRIFGLLLRVIFLAISTGTPPQLGLNPGSSLWSLNISTRIFGLLLRVILLAIPTGTLPELGLNPGSSLWSLNISTSHSKLITVEYPPMKVLLSFDGQLGLSRPSLVSIFTQGPGFVTSVRAKAQSALAIVTDLGANSLVSTLNGVELPINFAVKAKRRLRLGPWWVAVVDVDVSCTGLSFTAPTDGEGGGKMVLRGNLSCSVDIIPRLCEVDEKLPMLSITNFSEPSPPGCGGDDWSSRAGQERCGPGLARSTVGAMLFLTLPTDFSGLVGGAVEEEAVLAARLVQRILKTVGASLGGFFPSLCITFGKDFI